MARSAEILVDGCAWAGTGNVLKIQKMLHICSEHSIDFSAKKKDDTSEEEEIDEEEEEVPEPSTPLQPATVPSEAPSVPSAPSGRGRFSRIPGEPDTPAPSASTPAGMDVDEDDLNKEGEERVQAEERQERVMRKQSIAVIGIALIAMGEEVGAEMALRHFQHLVSLLLFSIKLNGGEGDGRVNQLRNMTDHIDGIWRTPNPKSSPPRPRSHFRLQTPTPNHRCSIQILSRPRSRGRPQCYFRNGSRRSRYE